ncbi:hypothetical protein LQ50_02550 [Halalkalibacter okhensis]|uniref:4-hydroxybenzoyl-CoA thioesterase n=1 Tax=Halalkalibacter okhensis TaxID=333138 RepID=A0A0B0IG77_9BACI|nr:hypothetical protein LQ50_02550 [Halalkalibacter okhensis]
MNYHFLVKWGDTDAAGIVYSPNYYKWMDEATHHFFASMGSPLSVLTTVDKIGIPVLESNMQFKKALYFEESVEVSSSIEMVKDKVFTIKHTFYKSGEQVAIGQETRALASMAEEKLRAISIPESIREVLLKYQAVKN